MVYCFQFAINLDIFSLLLLNPVHILVVQLNLILFIAVVERS